MKKLFVLLFLLTGILSNSAFNQQLTIEQAVLQTGLKPIAPNLIWGGPTGGYLEVRSQSVVSIQAKTGKESVLITRDEINRLLEEKKIPALTQLTMPEVLHSGLLRFASASVFFDLDWNQKTLATWVRLPEDAENPAVDPAGGRVAYTTGANLYLIDQQGNKIQVTDDREPGILNGQSVSRNEFGIGSGIFWSPDGNSLAYYRKDERKVTEYPLVNSTVKPAAAVMIKYPMAGGESETVQVGIYHINTGVTVFLDEQAFGPDRYLTNLTWSPAGDGLFAAVLNRQQNHLLVNRYDAWTGKKTATLFEETSAKYVEPLNGLIFNKDVPGQFIWMSQRDGYNHLYLYRTDGMLVKQLTAGSWMVTDFLGWSNKGRYIYYRATDPDPLGRYVYRHDLQSGARMRLTPGEGTHSALISPDGKYLLDTYSSYSIPARITLRETGSRETRTLFDAPDPFSNLKAGKYQSFTIKAADKKTDLYGYLVLPPEMDPNKKYPVIVYVYGGPHAQLVLNTWMGGASGWQHYMAQLGYISMTLDNRGSADRGAAFEQVIHRNLGKAEMADQMEGIAYLFSLPYVDSNRIGVHGWSYGGFMTTSLMLNYPDIIKVGVAGGPVTDWRFYEVMYGERYMDTPDENPEGYELCSTLPAVKNLRGRLMLIHGDQDPVVVWQNSIAFVRKCIDEGKLVDYMIYPQHPHNVRGKDRVHLMRTVTRYFQEHL